MKNRINNLRETLPGIIKIDRESIDGYKFSRMYINELSSNIYDLFNDLSDKQLASIIRMARKYNEKNTSAMNLFMKDALIGIAGLIIQKRKKSIQ